MQRLIEVKVRTHLDLNKKSSSVFCGQPKIRIKFTTQTIHEVTCEKCFSLIPLSWRVSALEELITSK